jgi:predicted outer membrane repeat protein
MLNPKLAYSVLGLLLCTQASATTYYVRSNATGSGTGLSWTNAFTDLQEALSIAIPGDDIWVAAGQYRPTTTTTRTVSFVLRNGVDVYGGFAGTETDFAERDITSNPTVLNGDIGVIGDNTDNSYNVIKANSITTAIELDGFRIMNGRSGSTYPGGGLSVTNCLGGNVLVKNCTFLNNYANNYGGGIYLAAANLTIERCVFSGNESDNGGAICDGNNNGGYSNLTILDSRFTGNVAYSGACLYNTVDYDNLVIDRCIFTNNTSPNYIIKINYFATARLLNSYVIGNTVDGSFSNILYVNSISSTEDFQMINCTIADNFNIYNFPLQDEAVRLEETYHQVHNCIIYGNTPYAGRQVNIGPLITHSVIEGGHANGSDIIDQDPQFMSPYAGSPMNFDATGYDYTLQGSSPAINVGDNARVVAGYDLDLNDLPRIQGTIVDLGCFESSSPLSSSLPASDPSFIYFDAASNVLRTRGSGIPGDQDVRILDQSGRLCALLNMRSGEAPIALSAGFYVAQVIGRRVLVFTVVR